MYRPVALVACGLLFAVYGVRAEDVSPLRDPMQPFRVASGGAGGRAATPRFQLTAVLISTTRRVAIVNGKAYQSGELVDGAEVVLIESDAVHLRQRGEDLVIPLGRPGTGRQSTTQGETAK